jgi:hypothetical protein
VLLLIFKMNDTLLLPLIVRRRVKRVSNRTTNARLDFLIPHNVIGSAGEPAGNSTFLHVAKINDFDATKIHFRRNSRR